MFMSKKMLLFVMMTALLSAFTIPPAFAGDMPVANDDLQKSVANMAKQMKEMRKIIDAQNGKIQSLEQKTRDNVKIPGVPAVGTPTPMSEKDFQDALGNEIKNYKYFKNLKMGGDFRLRYEAFREQKSSADSLENRNRFRYRLRYGLENGIGDDLTVGFRLASAVLNSRESSSNPSSNTARTIYGGDPTSTNQTMGNPGLFSFNTIAIEKAYAKYNPKYLKDLALGPVTIKGAELGGGKFENPFLKYSSPMVWDADVTPEGIYEKIDMNLWQNEGNEVNWFGTAMQSPVKEAAAGEQDANLLGFQTGFNVVGYTPMMERPVEFNSAVAFYDWQNYASDQNFTFDAGTTSLARGNTTCLGGTSGGAAGDCIGLEAGNPQVFDFYNEIKFTPANVPLKFFSDVASNVNNGSVSGTAAMKDTAWGLGMGVGELKNRGSWNVNYGFYSIPSNAVVGAFTDSDFGQGHANNVGGVLKAGYQLTDNMQVNFAWFNVRPYAQDLPTNGSVIGDHTTNRFQTDLVWKF